MRGPLRPSWSDDYETLAMILHHYAKRSTLLPLQIQRRAAEGLLLKSSVVKETRFEPADADGVPAEWFRHERSHPKRVLFYLHGGGYSIGSIDSHRDIISRLCRECAMTCLALDYRLAPEHRFPAQLEDSTRAYRWLLESGHDPSTIVIAGESAGGGLTLSTLVKLRQDGDPLPAGAVCISPWVDLEALSASMNFNARYDYLTKNVLSVYARRFVREDQLRDPLAAPLYADLHGLPPLLIQAGGAEVLLDDATRLAERARDAGVDTTLDVWEDMIHAWHVFGAFIPQAKQAIADIAVFTNRVCPP
jgi:acetyl esterase/lipase